MAAIPIYPAPTPTAPVPLRSLAPLGSPWTYGRALYLLLSFPLGVVYFVGLVAGGAAGIALGWTFIGIPILIALVLSVRWAGDLEALLVGRLVGVDFRRPPTWYEHDVPLREQAKQILIDPSTWTGALYLLSRFPLGIAGLVSVAVGVTLPFTLITAPLVYEPGGLGPLPGFSPPWDSLEIAWWTIDTAAEAWAAVPLGLAAALLAVHVWNLQAWLYGWWARVMLGSRARDIPPPAAVLEDGRALAAVAVEHPSIATLTTREREVLLLIARGYSNAEIAESFVVSEGTVKTHVKRILAKLGVRDRTQAAVFAFDSGFVTPESASEPEPR